MGLCLYIIEWQKAIPSSNGLDYGPSKSLNLFSVFQSRFCGRNILIYLPGGGGCLAQEKVVAEAAKLFVVIADQRKKVQHLGTTWKYVPIEVLPMAYAPLQKKIKVQLRSGYRMSKIRIHSQFRLFNVWYLIGLSHLIRQILFEYQTENAEISHKTPVLVTEMLSSSKLWTLQILGFRLQQ